PVYLVCAIFAPVLMSVFGPGFAAGRTALLILSLGMLPLVGSGNNKIVLLMGGGSGWNLFSAGLALSVNVGLNLILIPRLGINGAALAWAASILIDNVVITAVVWKSLGIHPFGRAYDLSILATVACFGVVPLAVRLTVGPTVTGLAVGVLLGGAAYIVTVIRLRHSLRVSDLREAIAAGVTAGAREASATATGTHP